jgi:hypothetical protein
MRQSAIAPVYMQTISMCWRSDINSLNNVISDAYFTTLVLGVLKMGGGSKGKIFQNKY